MKIKVSDIYDLSLGLDDLSNKELNIGTSLKVEKNQRIVSEELLPADKIRQKIIDKYKDDNVEVEAGAQIKEEHWSVYNEELGELMDQDVEINLQKIKLNELNGIKIKPRSIKFLNKILDKENAE